MPADHIPSDLVRSHYVVIRAQLQSARGFPKAGSCPTGAHGAPAWHWGNLRIEPGKLQCGAADAHWWLPWRLLILLKSKERALALLRSLPENEGETSRIHNRPSATGPMWSFNFLCFPPPSSPSSFFWGLDEKQGRVVERVQSPPTSPSPATSLG